MKKSTKQTIALGASIIAATAVTSVVQAEEEMCIRDSHCFWLRLQCGFDNSLQCLI